MVMRSTLLFFLLAIAVFQLEAQTLQGNSPWNEQNARALNLGTLEKNGLSVSKFRLFTLDQKQLTQPLQAAELAARNGKPHTVLPFPTAEGHLKRFKVIESNTMHPDLAKKFPAIKTYEGIGLDDPTATIRFEITQNGLTGMMWSAKTGTQVIQSLETDNQSDKYIVYNKKSASRNHKNHFSCGTDHIDQFDAIERQVSAARLNDGLLRTYRLALGVTAEYTALYGGKQGAMAQMATTMNRVNGILKRDVAVELQMVANNDQIIFTNATTDGYTNNDSNALLEENQTNVDNIIGNDNYDIGHVFSTGNGGVAYLGSVCINEIKAGGVTGSQLPQGDAFDVDYVTHEMGHQLGANHTQNNDCQSTFATSFEPGSGSTIMGYAGICFPNVQSNSDDYFHSISIDQIKGFTTGTADACATKTATNNSRPTVNAGSDYTVPHSTPFELEGIASDANNDALTYSWEQMDNQAASMPPLATSDEGPAFRSLPPSNSPIRQFPKVDNNKNNTPTTWEVLPSVARTMNFRLTVRDNNQNGGNTSSDDTKITFAGNAGPFAVTAPNGGETFAAGINQTVSWDVAGSNQAPVNCTSVDILLSKDGGNTYPIVLAESVPNNGSAEVLFPNSAATSTARIKIKGRGNIFFDVSNSNFEVTQSAPGFDLTLAETQVICQGESASVNVSAVGVEGFSGIVNLSTQLPVSNTNVSFAATSINTGNVTTLNISTTSNSTPGTYQIPVTGTSGDKTVTKTLTLTIISSAPAAVTLNQPTNNATDVATAPTFEWTNIDATTNYTLVISDNQNFSNTVYTEANLADNQYTLPLNLENGRTYYWSVQSANQCGTGANSATRSFTVTNDLCFQYQNDEDFVISDGQPSTTVSPIIVNETGAVQSIKVNMDIDHSWVGDLILSLESPSGKKAVLTNLNNICGNEEELNLIFGEDGSGIIPCPPVSQNIFAPIESFDIFKGEESAGTWKLLVRDGAELDGGTLKSWNLEICRGVVNNEPLNIIISNTNNPDCNGASTGSIQATVVGGSPNYDITWSNGAKQLTLNELGAGTYSVTVVDGNGNSSNATATLTAPPALALEDIVQNVTCNDSNNGSIKVYPTGGTANYQYQWANGVRQFDNLNLPNGNYRVTVTDGNGCTTSQSYSITEPDPIELTFSSTNAQNGLNGSVALEVTGGTGDYTYDWSSGATTRDVVDLAPGTFTVVVTDENGCSVDGTVNVVTENTTTDSCYSVTVNITLDNYGEENQWELKDGTGQIIQQVGPFNNFENGSVQATTLCLPPGCYDFTIFDLWGDGMCCSYGQGGYEIIEDATGKVLARGGSFAKEETKNICLPTQNTDLSTIEYCGAQGRNTQYEWIQSVEIAGQVFTSNDDEGYGDYTDNEVTVPIGGTLDLAFTPGFGFFEYHENWQIWIDFNADGDFEDEGEDVFFISGNSTVSGTVGIPANAVAGKTRMRVAMKWGELIQPCESFSWGEVEDYTLVLTQPSSVGERTITNTTDKLFTTGKPYVYTTQTRENALDLRVFPNPTTNYLGLEWEDTDSKNYELTIYNSLGQLQKYQQIPTQLGANKTSIDVTKLPTGVYLLNLQNKDKVITKEFVVTH